MSELQAMSRTDGDRSSNDLRLSMSELQPMSRTDSDRSSNDLHDADDSLEPRATHGYALLITGINRGAPRSRGPRPSAVGGR